MFTRGTMVEVIQNVADLQCLAEDRNALAARFGTPLLRYEWFQACAEAFCPPAQLLILVVRSRGEVTGIAPLVLTRMRGLKRLALLGTFHSGEPGGFIYADEESLKQLVTAVIALRKPMQLGRIGRESPETGMFRQICQGRALLAVRDTQVSPWIPAVTSWREFEAKLSSHQRNNLRRYRKRAEASGKVKFEILSPGMEELEHHLLEMFRVEASSWKGRSGTAILSKPWSQRFFTLYSHAAARLGILRLCFLRIDGRTIAARLAIEYANRFWVLKIGYDEEWARCAPGTLLAHETIRYAFEHGLEAYEFLGTDDPWEHFWTDQVHSYVVDMIYPLSAAGLLALAIDASCSVARRALITTGKISSKVRPGVSRKARNPVSK